MFRASMIAGVVVLAFGGCALKKLTPEMGNPKWGLEVEWHGHSCFTLRDSLGRTLVIDPFDETVGYGRLSLRADALLITHPHFDHNYRRAVRPRLAETEIVESSGTATVASGLLVTGIPSFHDEEGGQINGPNTMFAFVMGGLRCLHMGDFGQKSLTPYQRKLIGPVDVLFIPVGGVTTIDAARAKDIVKELNPSWVFPMHYGNIRFYRLDPLSKFTSLFPSDLVKELNDSHIRIREAEKSPEPMVIALSPDSKNY